MEQGWRGMAQGHRPNAAGARNGRRQKWRHGNNRSHMAHAGTSTGVRFAAIEGGMFALGRLGNVSGTDVRRLSVMVAWRHGKLGFRHCRTCRCVHFARLPMHLCHLHGRHRRGRPVEHQGNAQHQAQQDGATRHESTLLHWLAHV